MKKTVDDLDARIDALRALKAEREQADYEKNVRPKFREMVGNCYRYKNSYGGDSKSWWLYARIAEFVEGSDGIDYFLLEKHEITDHGYAQIRTEYDILGSSMYNQGTNSLERMAYDPISSERYEAARQKTFDEFHTKRQLRAKVLED